MINRSRTLSRIAIGCWSIPLLCVVLCFTYYWRAQSSLGFTPTYGNPDPKTLGFYVHHILILLSLLSIYPALIVSFVSSILLIVSKHQKIGYSFLLFTGFILVSLHLLASTDFADEFFAWYLD